MDLRENDIYNIRNMLFILCLFLSLTWIYLYYFFFMRLGTNNKYFNGVIILLPIIIIWVNYLNMNKDIIEEKNKNIALDLQYEDKLNKFFIDILPITIFGTGILITSYIPNLSSVIRIFYLVIIFGLLIPLVIKSLDVINKNLYLSLIYDFIEISSKSISFSCFFVLFYKLYMDNYSRYKSYVLVVKNDNLKIDKKVML